MQKNGNLLKLKIDLEFNVKFTSDIINFSEKITFKTAEMKKLQKQIKSKRELIIRNYKSIGKFYNFSNTYVHGKPINNV